jgi:asparagine synthetase B (glutamine-hydrolysing)
VPALILSLGNPALLVERDQTISRYVTPGKGLEIIIARYPDGSLAKFSARRGNGSSDDLYWHLFAGTLHVSDNFHDAVAGLSPKHRDVDPTSIVDHFLFRTVPGDKTYLRAIHRLGSGSHLSWSPGEPPTIGQPNSIVAERSTDFLKDIEHFLEQEISAANTETITNMLSGGIDSTLIQSFLGKGSRSISVTIDSPEYSIETKYALAASKLLGSSHYLVQVSEATWLRDVVDTISTLGLPPQHLQTALMHRAFDAPFARLMTGQYADALFGLDAASIKTENSPWTRSGLKSLVKSLIPLVLFDPIRKSQLQLLRRHPVDPASFAATFACYSDLDLMLRIFGSAQVNASLRRRAAYTLACIGADIPRGIDGHLHVGHWVDFFCDDTVSLWRQLGFDRGKELVAPFATETAARMALSIPAAQRYISHERVKYLLKDLLRRRVPAYDVDKPKGHSSLPLYRFANDGLFESMREAYPTPSYLEPISFALSSTSMGQSFAETRWNLFALTVWHHEIVCNKHLRCHQASHYLELD